MENKAFALRYTPARGELVERLRVKLKAVGRQVETLHGVVTNAYVLDEALKALERELDKELKK